MKPAALADPGMPPRPQCGSKYPPTGTVAIASATRTSTSPSVRALRLSNRENFRSDMIGLPLRKYPIDPRFESRCGKGLDDEVVGAGIPGGQRTVQRRFGGDHDETGLRQRRIGANFLEQIAAAHGFHVPVRDHQPVISTAQFLERAHAASDRIDIPKADPMQQTADDVGHRREVVDHEDRHREINAHARSRAFCSRTMRGKDAAPIFIWAWAPSILGSDSHSRRPTWTGGN